MSGLGEGDGSNKEVMIGTKMTQEFFSNLKPSVSNFGDVFANVCTI